MTDVKKGLVIYEGKAKKIYNVEGDQDLIVQEYKDSLTAFNAQKKGSFKDKGHLNRDICSMIYRALEKRSIPTHWVRDDGALGQVTRKLEMIKLEVVVRNILAGSTAKKLGIEEGLPLAEPLVELYFKDDSLADPFISDDQAMILKTVKTRAELEAIKTLALKVNTVLKGIFSAIGIVLVDFKLEFGRDSAGRILLADEVSPDTCRLWDQQTHEKMDKDRFRRDLGGVEQAYREVHRRLHEKFGGSK